MPELNFILCGVAFTVYCIQVSVSLYREHRWNNHRDDLIRHYRIRETELLNRYFAENAKEYAMLNNQAADLEVKHNSTQAQVEDHPPENIADLLDTVGLGPNGYSKDGVAVT